MKILGIIPSRYGSTRFPGKPLIDINGKSMIQRVFEQAQQSGHLTDVIVATDDERIFNHVKSFDGKVIMTSSSHESGTDRCEEVVNNMNENFDVIINIQGDEPFIDPSQIELLCQSFVGEKIQMSSLAKKITTNQELFNANTVKVVIGSNGKALYFSRAVIPYVRGVEQNGFIEKTNFYKHIGLYAYRSDVLKEICDLPIAELEKTESLEQLRWLSAGYEIDMKVTKLEGISVDTPEDLLKLTNKT